MRDMTSPCDLLSCPGSQPELRIERQRSAYADLSDDFQLQERTFQRQYAHVYAARLWTQRAALEKAAGETWGEKRPC